jgi:ectoine hydroxylase-related dioxygenase (phytanoyl-CoA dioxygenase family)
LSQEQIQEFDRQGFLVLRHRIAPHLLERLQEAARQWVRAGKELKDSGTSGDDYRFGGPNGRTMFRVDYLHDKKQPASLALLGSPEMLGITESLAGPNFVPTYESLVFKDVGNGAAINWHQDAVHPRRSRIFNVDIYLDQSRPGQGALRVLPGSQKRKVDICSLEEQHGWDSPDALEVEMDAGDVLVHDVMLVHGSPATEGRSLRRTLYYEFRPAEQILAEGPWDRAWVDKRLRLIPLAMAAYAEQFPDGPQFTWNLDAGLRPAMTEDREAELRVAHAVHSPGSYCSAGDVPVGA